ncbi:MAG: dTDP-4-dehydrorhamnose 3,5-epimerase family protein [Dehalococcoidia bacterium]|nr:dTDP-4-dehydrorhamnose 3,5-epimerase family protein [Dehalococcoidia bacterium]
MIEGVELKALVTHSDERGFFREIARTTEEIVKEGWAQVSHSLMHPGVAKAWHVHPTQIDWWYVPAGDLKVALYDTREGSATRGQLDELFLGEHYDAQLLKIPAGVAHGCRVIGGTAHLVYLTSGTYDTAEERRIPHDDPTIGYDWTAPPPIT